MKSILNRITRRLKRLRYRPIRVFSFHQVSDVFDPDMMWKCDWIQTEVFKRRVLDLKKRYTFISIEDVYGHICGDRIRYRRYAALTADDGCYSMLSVIPWLAEQEIPVTLFVNPSYMQGYHNPNREHERFMTYDDLKRIVLMYSPYVSVASHGWFHKKRLEMTDYEFQESVLNAEAYLAEMPGKKPFFAFPFGGFRKTDSFFLIQQGLIPVMQDGRNNMDDGHCIHRENLM